MIYQEHNVQIKDIFKNLIKVKITSSNRFTIIYF